MFEKVEPVTQEELELLYMSKSYECNQELVNHHVKEINEKLKTAAVEDKLPLAVHMLEGDELEFHVRKVFEKADYEVMSTPVKGYDIKSLYSLTIWRKVE